MAATTVGAELTELHRLAQARLGGQTIAQMFAAWGVLDIAALDAATINWLRITVPLIQFQRQQSANLAGAYMKTFREVEIGGTTPTVFAQPAPLEQLTTSLTTTGPIHVKQALARGETMERALLLGRISSARAAQRHVLNGGRDTIIDTTESDPLALGYARTTSGRACAFCAMLASRGPVYKTKGTALTRRSDGRRYHDNCHCGAEPSYHSDDPWPDGARDYQALWNSSTRGHSGKDAINAFRREIDALDRT